MLLPWLLPAAVAACRGSCHSVAADLPKVQWALRVWTFWPGVAELEIRPEDLMPAAERALSMRAESLPCRLAQLALQLFILCGMGREEQLQAMKVHEEAVLTEIDVLVQSCGMANLIESGWPFFSLLALLRAGGVGAGEGAPQHASWVRHVRAAWGAVPQVGPPPPESDVVYAPPRWSRKAPGKPRPRLRPRPVSGLADGLHMAAVAAARAAACEVPRWRRGYVKVAEAALQRHMRSGRRTAGTARSRNLLTTLWPVCESLSLVEMGLFAVEPQGQVLQGLPPWVGQEFLRKLWSQLGAAHWDPEPSVLATLPGSVLPSEALLFHTLADLEGVQVIVESGVSQGGSTRAACAWARAVPGRRVLALERSVSPAVAAELQSLCGGVLTLKEGDTFNMLDSALAAAGNATALLLDGPKGRVAVRLAEDAMRRFPGLRVAAVHDVPRLDSRYRDEQGRHLTRVAMEASPCLQVFSDEPWYVANFARRIDVGTSWSDTSSETGAATLIAAMDPVRQANLSAYVASAPKTGSASTFSALWEKKQLLEARRKRSTMNFMERMEVDSEHRQALAQVTEMRRNEDHRKALDRLIEGMRPENQVGGPKIVKHNGKALHQGHDRKLNWAPLECY
ncbi:unnamed protein product [Symbiodinium necroappetens]|uniref:Uncharacterized protein n=1 Tax=Symbiodinium necroappetens TaxID=1628268 RepID=A0A813ANA6_9DINO|nr:unnamed protein product [Symbiodinium necroappetens]